MVFDEVFVNLQGDSVILAYEYVSNDPPCLFAVSSFNCGSAHQVCISMQL